MDTFIGTHAEYDKVDATKIYTMTCKPIKNKKDYNDALERLEIIFEQKRSSFEVENYKY